MARWGAGNAKPLRENWPQPVCTKWTRGVETWRPELGGPHGQEPSGRGQERKRAEHLLHVGPRLGFVAGPLHSMVTTTWPMLPQMCRYVHLCAAHIVHAPWALFLVHLPDPSWEVMRLALPGSCWDCAVSPCPPCCLCPSCPQLTEGHAEVRPPALHTPEVAAGPLHHLS